jgi:hypothetical protein
VEDLFRAQDQEHSMVSVLSDSTSERMSCAPGAVELGHGWFAYTDNLLTLVSAGLKVGHLHTGNNHGISDAKDICDILMWQR